jgi:4-amino-4-deoxy-L-arabinose transferase-like glycosyltransferase
MPASRRFLAPALDEPRTAYLVLMLHLLIWTALPLLVSTNLPLDVVEALAWGREWQWGYYKHPPLSGWIAELARFGSSNWSLFLLAQVMVTTGLAGAWLLGRDLLGTRLATLALMATQGIHYFNLSSTEFNANVVMFPLWAWASLCFWRAMQNGRLIWWLGLGLCCGLGTLGKYVFLLLPACMFIYTLAHPVARRCWATIGPWSALVVFGGIVAPHLSWAVANDWATLHYALGRGHSEELARQGSWLKEFINFTLSQLLALLPLWMLLRSLGPATRTPRPSEQRWLILTLALGPLLMIMSAAALAQAKMLHMWASPFFLCAAPLYLALRAPAEPDTRRFIKACVLWVSLTIFVFASSASWGPQKKRHLDRTGYPGAEIAQTLTTQWRTRTGQALGIVSGEEFVAGTVAHYSSDRPSVFYGADFSKSRWLQPEQVLREGALFVWPIGRGNVGMPIPADSRAQVQPLLARYPALQAQPILRIHTSWMGKPYTVAVAWALLPPAALKP